MPELTVTQKKLRFDAVRQSRAVYVKVDTDPQTILELLDFHLLPRGIISISGGAARFPSVAEKKTVALIKEVIVPIVYEHGLLVVDGGTDAGVMRITGKVFRAKCPDPIIIGGRGDKPQNEGVDFHPPPLLGFAPEPRVFYPGVERSPQRDSALDPNHFYFVLVCDAEDWGEEVECMFSFLDYLAAHKRIPIVNIVANGGRITIKEVYHAVQKGWQVIVLEGSQRAAEVIIAALDGASRRDLVNLLDRCEVPIQEHEVEETVCWLNIIAQYDKIIRFEFLSRSPKELRGIILSELGT